MEPAVEVIGLAKRFGERAALNGVDLTIRQGEMVALLGASGSGKSTLLRHLCGLTAAERGAVRVLGRTIQQDGVLARNLRAARADVAMIFQQFNLVGRLPVMLNVLTGALHRQPAWRGLLRRFPAAEYALAWQAMSRVGIEHCAWQRASTLSGGQQQRAAISRAMLQGAKVILADEPIASLDPESARNVMELLAGLHRGGATVIVSLHQIGFAFAFCPRSVALHQGRVVYDGPTNELTPERLRELYGAASDEWLGATDGKLEPGAGSEPPSAPAQGTPASVRPPPASLRPVPSFLPPSTDSARWRSA